jgi:hypothetical protein
MSLELCFSDFNWEIIWLSFKKNRFDAYHVDRLKLNRTFNQEQQFHAQMKTPRIVLCLPDINFELQLPKAESDFSQIQGDHWAFDWKVRFAHFTFFDKVRGSP